MLQTQLQGDEAVFLLGRPPMQEFISFIKFNTVDGSEGKEGLLAHEWRVANDRVVSLEEEDAGLADNQSVLPLHDDLAQLAERLAQHPVTTTSFALLPFEIGMVELDRLVVYQKHINLRFVRELQASLGSEPSPEDLFKFTLPTEPAHPPFRVQRQNNGWVFQSLSQDFRVLDAPLLRPDQLRGYISSGFPAAVAAVIVGYGSNFLQAARVEGRLILGNGSHRAYALRDLGITHAPAIIQHVSRRDELPVLQMGDVAERADYYLRSKRPPLLKDYFDPTLRKIVRVPRTAVQIRVLLVPEPSIVPLG